jgi:hypothetical protein
MAQFFVDFWDVAIISSAKDLQCRHALPRAHVADALAKYMTAHRLSRVAPQHFFAGIALVLAWFPCCPE